MNSKSTLLLCMIVLFASNAFAQPKIKAQKLIGGDNKDELCCMVRTPDGGLLAGGSSRSGISGNKTDSSRGSYDYWIVKLDANGKKQWDKTFGGKYGDILTAILKTNDGGYLLGGTSGSGLSGDKTVDKVDSGPDFWMIKLDAGFNKVWDNTFEREPEFEGVYYYNEFQSVQQTSDGGYIISGTTQYEDDLYSIQYIIAKCDALGNTEWSKVIPVGMGTAAFALETTGGYLVGGSNYNAALEQSYYQSLKLDASGNIVWNKTYPTAPPSNEYYTHAWVTCVTALSNGNFILGGYVFDDYSIGGYDYRLLEIDANGNQVSDKRIGGTHTDQLTSITKTSDGGWILGGYSNSDISGNKTENHRGTNTYTDGYDYWVVKTDNNFNVQWDKTVGGYEEDVLNSIIEIAPNRYSLGGSSISGISGDKKSASKGDMDYWGVILDYNQQEAIKTGSSIAFTVYPNPASTVLNIQLKGKSLFSLNDKSGRTILTKTIDTKGSIDVSNLKTGVYFISTPSGAKQQVMIIK